jgi:uncharacterized protein
MNTVYIRTDRMIREVVDKESRNQSLTEDDNELLRALGCDREPGNHNMLGAKCGVGRNALAVDATGNLYPCHRYIGMNAYVVGHVQHGLEKATLVRYFGQLLKAYSASCSACDVNSSCTGPCSWSLSQSDGTLSKVPSNYCRMVQNEVERQKRFAQCMRGREGRRDRTAAHQNSQHGEQEAGTPSAPLE